MLVFHIGQIQLKLEPKLHLFDFHDPLSAFDARETGVKLSTIKQIAYKTATKSIPIDAHIFDNIAPVIGDLNAFALYLLLYRLSEHQLIVTTVKALALNLASHESDILSMLGHLEERQLISIRGHELLKIELNQRWSD